MGKLLIEVSVGELLDKLSILDIKKRKISDKNKLQYVKKEYDILYKKSVSFLEKKEIEILYEKILKINEELWVVEDSIRDMEKCKIFDLNFITLARNVYVKNDERFSLKNEINILCNSKIKEQKSYGKY